MSSHFTIEEYLNTEFESFWITDEELAEAKELADKFRDYCIEHKIPMLISMCTGDNGTECRMTTHGVFQPLSRVAPELLLAQYLQLNGVGPDFASLYTYVNSHMGR